MRMYSRIPLVLLAPFSLLLPAASAGETVLHDDWMALYMMDSKVGYGRQKLVEQTRGETTVIVSTEKTVMRIKRMGVTMEISEHSRVEESAGGRLISFRSKTKQSIMASAVKGTVEGDTIVIERFSGGRRTGVKKIPYDPKMMTPCAFDRLIRKDGIQKGEKHAGKVFVPSMPDEPVDLAVTVLDKEETDVLGQKRLLWHTTAAMTVKGMPIETEQWVSDDGIPWKIRIMNGLVCGYKVPEKVAVKKGNIKDVFKTSLVVPDRPIPNARKARDLRYRLTLPAGKTFSDFPAGAGQEVLANRGNVLEVRVRTVAVEKSLDRPVPAKDMKQYLASTPFLQVDDPAVSRTAATAVGDEKNALKAARRLEKWVHRNISKKHLGLGFATAAEVVKNLEGDCSEHSVLLAALCRAVGIPSRVVGGLIYADALAAGNGKGAFGMHMWTEVYVGCWVPLDATIGAGYCDAAHIAVAKSSLESESDMVHLLPLATYMGTLNIEVIDGT